MDEINLLSLFSFQNDELFQFKYDSVHSIVAFRIRKKGSKIQQRRSLNYANPELGTSCKS